MAAHPVRTPFRAIRTGAVLTALSAVMLTGCAAPEPEPAPRGHTATHARAVGHRR